jgi:hypothetical protein
MSTDTDTRPPTARELAAELRRRLDHIDRAQGVRRLVASAYEVVVADLDERDRYRRTRRIADATT